MPRDCHRQRLDVVLARPQAAMAHGGCRQRESLSPPLSESTIASTLCSSGSFSRAHPYPLQVHLPLQICFPTGCFCFIITTCLHFFNCLGFLMQLGEKKTLHLSASDSYFSIWSLLPKIPYADVAFIAALYFYLAILYPTKCRSPPVPPVLTSGQRFLPFLITISLTCYDSTQNHCH